MIGTDLEKQPPRYVLAYPDEHTASGFTRGNARDQVIIGDYLRAHYDVAGGTQIAGVTLIRRRQQAEPEPPADLR